VNLAEELAVMCITVKEASEKEAFLNTTITSPTPKTIFSSLHNSSPTHGLARQATQAVNQHVAEKQNQVKEQQAPTVDPISSSSIGPIKPINIGISPIRKGYVPPNTAGIGAPIPIKTAADNSELVDLTRTRSKFESLAARERLLRAHSKKWEDLAAARAEREEPGYLDTFTKRMIPIPHTLGEAATRAAISGLTGYGGYSLAAKTEPIDLDELNQVIGATRSKEQTLRPIESNLADLFGKDRAVNLVRRLRKADPEVASEALRETDIFSPSKDVRKLRIRLNRDLGPEGNKGKMLGSKLRGRIKSEIGNLFKQTQEEGFIPKLNWRRLGGAGAGIALGSVLSGIPFALHALYRKGEGGEAAYRAKQEAQRITDEANALAAEREALLD
jgi:hypothetical protein